jgi:cyanuric acid amidohydrolase
MTARPISIDVIRIPTSGPGDVSGLLALIDAGEIAPSEILAVLGKTEGNGGVNDFTREYAVAALREALAPRLGLAPHAVEEKIAFVMSGGTEGVLSPHLTVFARKSASNGAATVAPSAAKEVGQGGQQAAQHRHRPYPRFPARRDRPEGPDRRDRASAVHQAMRDAGIDDPKRCAFRPDQMPAADQRADRGGGAARHKTVTTGGYASMGYSRGASALGVALALGEIGADVATKTRC